MEPTTWARVLCLLILLGILNAVHTFKAEEFKKCSQANFCQRNRDKSPDSSTFSLASGVVHDGRFMARLINSAFPEAEIFLEVAAYSDGIVRLRVTEDPSKKRFEVPDVLVASLDRSRSPLFATRLGSPATSTGLRFGVTDISIQHNPFSVEVSRNGKTLLSLNRRGLFNFEHLREKKEGDADGEWTEVFRSFTDTKPRGPESIAFDISFHGADYVYGIPQHALDFELPPTRGPEIQSEPYRLYNLDVFEYLADSPFGLYGSIPFMLSHSRSSGHTAGFFWLNSAEMFIDVLKRGWEGEGAAPPPAGESPIETHWIAESGILDGFFFVGPDPKDVVRQYGQVTGTTAMPQLFSIAYHQCRWNYKDEADVFGVDKGFDDHDIPYDVIWLDIEHTDGKKYMTWDHTNFPHPIEMQNRIAAKGRKMVTIVDPHVKRDNNFPLHKEATAKGYYVKDASGNDYDGWCWPGSSSYLDVTNPEIRSWWADKFSLANYVGSTPNLYIWNDMNEPSVFNGPEVTMPKDNLHFNNVEHRDVHNAYGYYYHMATAEGLLRRGGGNDRPFVLSRAFFAGTQRVGPIWTGDNAASWEHLKVSVPMLLSLGVTGMAFSGADVGGFFGNPDAELITRWYQLGAFYPFFRGHAHLDTKRREPWLFGEPYTSIIRTAIKTRYALLPYLYTLFWEAHQNGIPVLRPIWMEFPKEAEIAVSQHFMLGSDILVRGVFEQGATAVDVYLPGSEPWYEAWTGKTHRGGQWVNLKVDLATVPFYQRGGSIVPRKDRPRRASSLMVDDPYTLVVALNSSYAAEGELFIDDGKSYAFEKGAYIHRRFVFANGQIESSDAAPAGASGRGFAPSTRVERIVVLGLPSGNSANLRRAMVEESRRTENLDLTVEVGPPLLHQGVPSTAVVIRLPNVLIASDWSIKIAGL
eukprot:TRINITY_DN1237_c0_g1_i1.p1 TRINITY_DN1237_c0_g1~~TRINITY_DN1237_c0_g1_i1.p1  ORF type:complete len:920 (+),score=153.19 TRINITY_DN1237_c0_g1_i1:85-2844(+)